MPEIEGGMRTFRKSIFFLKYIKWSWPKDKIHSVVKKSEETIDSYFQRINENCEQVAAVSVILEGEDLVNELPNAYEMFKTSLRTRSQLVSFYELQIQLCNEEKMLDKNSVLDFTNSISALAMVANFEGRN